MPAPYSTVAEAQAYHPAAGGADQAAKASDVLSDAADFVARLAPPPAEPPPADYQAKAARCERRVFAYLWDTGGGYITGSSISGAVSDSFAGIAGVREIVESVMGEYAGGKQVVAGSSYTLGVVSTFPPEA